jgi:membrane peptidoglycan carboxypeptidase
VSVDRDLRHRLGLLAAVAALAGLLVAGLLAPFIGGLAVVARASADSFEQLPSELKTPPLPQASKVLAADGTTIATFYDENRILVPLSRVATSMRYAIIAIEDSRFYEHRGIDIQGALRAALNNAKGGSVQGGSTITQQYVKNVLVEQATTTKDVKAARAQDVSRKLRELKYALTLEDKLSKDQILENYLNIAYFGDGAYGIESAARHYFGVTAARLTLPQSALLAGIVRSPVAYDPTKHPKAAKLRRDTVLSRMGDLHFAGPADVTKAMAEPIRLRLQADVNGCVTSVAPWFCDFLIAYFRVNPELGGERALKENGLIVRTTLDLKAQRAADAAVKKYVSPNDAVAASVAMVEPGTGHVLAIAESRDYTKYKVNLAIGRPYSPNAGGQPGSTFKAFTLAAALDQGIPIKTMIRSPGCYLSKFAGDVNGHYKVCNAADSEQGTFNLLTGTWASVNTFFVQLEERVGLQAAKTMASGLGVHRADGRSWQANGSWTLGADEVAPLDMAMAYATLAAHGVRCEPVMVTSVTTAKGQQVAVPPPTCQKVLDPGVADTVTQILTGVIDGKFPGRTGKAASLGRPAAGKTGTNTDYHGAWFVGYTPQIATAVGMWNPKSPNTYQLKNVRIGGKRYSRVFGATIPAPIWKEAMLGALEGVPVVKFAPASKEVADGQTTALPDVAGLSVEDATARLKAAGFTVAVASGAVPSLLPAGTVAYTNPRAGSLLPAGAPVTIYVSSGIAPTIAPTTPPTKPPNPKPTKPPPTASPKPTHKPKPTPSP